MRQTLKADGDLLHTLQKAALGSVIAVVLAGGFLSFSGEGGVREKIVPLLPPVPQLMSVPQSRLRVPRLPEPLKPIETLPFRLTHLQPINTVSHTQEIGTIDHPTLDGGIINAADGIPVIAAPEPAKAFPTAERNKNTSPVSLKREAAPKGPFAFDDRWASAPQILRTLSQAAARGQLGYVLTQSTQKNLPASVALVPLIESGYQDQAVSPKGAVGSWQLMAQTARENGIVPEGRTDFKRATGAALNYLTHLHQDLGNWTLAFAAYNAGENRIRQALLKYPTADSLEALHLPAETVHYVHRLESATQSLEQSVFHAA